MNSNASSDKLVNKMLTHLKPPIPLVDQDNNSEVADFYSDRSVFVTGATGFIGKAIIEKLIRSCDKIKRIFILVREKRGKDVHERLIDLIKSQCFDRIREAHGGSNRLLEEKIYAVKGDITLPKFGISPEDMQMLCRDCSIVFNSAATVRFEEPIDVAVSNNIYSVGQLVEFCNELEHLDAIVHLSTAYSNCHKRDIIHEIFYEPPMRGDEIQETINKLRVIQGQIHSYKEVAKPVDEDSPARSDCKLQRFYFDQSKQSSSVKGKSEQGESDGELDLLKSFTEVALKLSNRPNTYTFTKAISEVYLLDKVRARPDRYLGEKIPVAVVRPSIVGGAWREPIVGLVDNFNGPTGAILSMYTGALQGMPGLGGRVADIVPVDMVTNMVLCAGWFLVEHSSKKASTEEMSAIKPDYGLYLFNFVSGNRNPVRWHVVTDNIAEMAYKYPSKMLTRLPSPHFVQAGRIYDLFDLINQKIPAYVLDFVRSKLLGRQLDRKSSAMAAYSRIRQMTDTLTPFTSHQWKFSDTNVRSLFESLNAVDRTIFHFDVNSISWPDYMKSYIIGSRIYTLKDEPKSVSKALTTIKRRQIISGITMSLIVMVMFYLIFLRSHTGLLGSE